MKCNICNNELRPAMDDLNIGIMIDFADQMYCENKKCPKLGVLIGSDRLIKNKDKKYGELFSGSDNKKRGKNLAQTTKVSR